MKRWKSFTAQPFLAYYGLQGTMTEIKHSDENADQAAYWNGPAGQKWVAYQGRLDATMQALSLLALDAADPRTGERVIDVGCGCGTTSLALAERVGAGGEVLGIDISEPMLALARRRAAGRSGLRFVEADASAYAFADASADLLFSRFGIMFFRDPVKAFTNLRRGLRRGGRLTFLCWRAVADNEWVMVPLRAALTIVPAPPSPPPNEPGPFAFADAGYVHDILKDAGFDAIELTPHNRRMTLGGDGDFAVAVEFALAMGPTARLLANVDGAVVARASAAVAEALQAHRQSDGVHLDAAVWIVSARNPA